MQPHEESIMRQIQLGCWLALLCVIGPASQAQLQKGAPPSITEISLERSLGRADSPQDLVTLRSDGTATYEGSENVDKIGKYQGKVSDWYFAKTFPQIAKAYVALRGKPVSTGKPTKDVTTMTLRVTVDGKFERIADLCPGSDDRLWLLEMSIRGVAGDIRWEKAK
jgi:hypothetical protein